MSGDDAPPPPESCAHNLHRVGDGRTPRAEPTDLCRNALGVFHMTDCPLTIGLSCSYYEASAAPHPTTGDLDLEAAREEMQSDFLGWRYRRRVRWLTKPKNVVPAGIVFDPIPEPEEVVPEALAMRVPPPAPVDPSAAPVAGAAPAANETTGPVAPAAPERYPGQRRSEERLAKKKARLAARDAAASAAKAARIAAVAASVPSEGGPDDEDGDDAEFGDDLGVEADEEREDTGPKTVEQVLAALPDAPVVVHEPRRQGGGPQRRGPGGQGGPGGGPPREGGPRRRRRRGRRGGGGGSQGGGGGGGGGQGGPRGPRPGGGPPRPPQG